MVILNCTFRSTIINNALKHRGMTEALYVVTESDLIGELEGFSIEIAERMLAEQVRQGNEEDIRVFQDHACANADDGGFDWDRTVEGHKYWRNAIYSGGRML